MQQGIALLNENTAASLVEAVRFFDQALAIRTAAIVAGDHWLSYLTAASWMNRGDALTRLGQPAQIAEAVRSYDEALALMRAVPLEANPLYRRRLAIAWMNRGISWHEQETAAGFAEAAQSFEQAIAVVDGHPEHVLLLACAWMNRGNALLRTAPPRLEEVRASAAAALKLLTEVEQQDLLAAETALKARYLICQAVAEWLADQPATDYAFELTSAATDAVEEGLRLARHWDARGERRFRPLAEDFFRFGMTAYRVHQPQFLAEFVIENLDPARPEASFSQDPAMHRLAAEALSAVARDLQADGYTTVRTPRFDSLLETLRALQWMQSRLDVLRDRPMDTL
ncbi:MAG: hypothetical protein WDN28_07280 [Chthoniobacter sp.]